MPWEWERTMTRLLLVTVGIVGIMVGALLWRSSADNQRKMSAMLQQEESTADKLRAELVQVRSNSESRILGLKSQVSELTSSGQEKDRNIADLRKKLLAVSRGPSAIRTGKKAKP